MMVKILRGVVADGCSYSAGQEVEIKDNTARLLIDIGKADKIQPKENIESPESLNESPLNRMETAPVKRGRKSKE